MRINIKLILNTFRFMKNFIYVYFYCNFPSFVDFLNKDNPKFLLQYIYFFLSKALLTALLFC